MPEAATSTTIRRARIFCAMGALVCVAIFLVSMFAASMQEDRVRTRAVEHGLTVCHPNTTCRPPAGRDVACAGAENEECRLSNGAILMAGHIEYAEERPTRWKLVEVAAAVLGITLLLFLFKLSSADRTKRKDEAKAEARLDRAVRDAEARAAEARAKAARAASAD